MDKQDLGYNKSEIDSAGVRARRKYYSWLHNFDRYIELGADEMSTPPSIIVSRAANLADMRQALIEERFPDMAMFDMFDDPSS